MNNTQKYFFYILFRLFFHYDCLKVKQFKPGTSLAPSAVHSGGGCRELRLHRQRRQQRRPHRVLRSLVRTLQEPGAQVQGAGREGEACCGRSLYGMEPPGTWWSLLECANLVFVSLCSWLTTPTWSSPRWTPPPTMSHLSMKSAGESRVPPIFPCGR